MPKCHKIIIVLLWAWPQVEWIFSTVWFQSPLFTSHHSHQDADVRHPSVFLGFAVSPRHWQCDEWETDTFGSVDHCSLWRGISDWERVSEAESLPRHSGPFKLELFLNQGIGKARDGTRDDNIVFFTLRETLQWYEPDGIQQMRMSEAISSSAQGEREGSVGAYVTLCVSESECMFTTVPACVSVHSWDYSSMFVSWTWCLFEPLCISDTII